MPLRAALIFVTAFTLALPVGASAAVEPCVALTDPAGDVDDWPLAPVAMADPDGDRRIDIRAVTLSLDESHVRIAVRVEDLDALERVSNANELIVFWGIPQDYYGEYSVTARRRNSDWDFYFNDAQDFEDPNDRDVFQIPIEGYTVPDEDTVVMLLPFDEARLMSEGGVMRHVLAQTRRSLYVHDALLGYDQWGAVMAYDRANRDNAPYSGHFVGAWFDLLNGTCGFEEDPPN